MTITGWQHGRDPRLHARVDFEAAALRAPTMTSEPALRRTGITQAHSS
jgi:hypothetical protein